MGKIACSYMLALPTEEVWHMSFSQKTSIGIERFGS